MKDFRYYLPLAASLMVMVIPTACSKKTDPTAIPELVRGVRVFQTTSQNLPETVDTIGTVRATESVMLSSQVMGMIATIAVREGDHVRAGQTLISIDAAQLSAQADRAHASLLAIGQQVAAAESDASLTASTLKRFEILKMQKSVSPQEFDEVQSRAQAASARLAMVRSQEGEARAAESAARTMQSYSRICAPFDGIVAERKVDPGAMAAPGIPLLTIERAGPFLLEVSVDESLLSLVRVGAGIQVTIDTLGAEPVEGKILQIVPAADPGTRSFLVKIDLPVVRGLHSGMFGHARLPRASRDILLIPQTAIVAHGSMQSIYAVGQNHIAELRYISAGSSHGNEVEVLSGLGVGETVIDSPGERELSGKRIEVQP